jgi:hypothetical protein
LTRRLVGTVGGAPAKKWFENSRGDEEVPLLSVIVTTYWRPFVSPVRLQPPNVVVVHDAPPGEAVAVYDVTGAPPSSYGGSQETCAPPITGAALKAVGAPGATTGRVGIRAVE